MRIYLVDLAMATASDWREILKRFQTTTVIGQAWHAISNYVLRAEEEQKWGWKICAPLEKPW
jgi:hypothetical protein